MAPWPGGDGEGGADCQAGDAAAAGGEPAGLRVEDVIAGVLGVSWTRDETVQLFLEFPVNEERRGRHLGLAVEGQM